MAGLPDPNGQLARTGGHSSSPCSWSRFGVKTAVHTSTQGHDKTASFCVTESGLELQFLPHTAGVLHVRGTSLII